MIAGAQPLVVAAHCADRRRARAPLIGAYAVPVDEEVGQCITRATLVELVGPEDVPRDRSPGIGIGLAGRVPPRRYHDQFLELRPGPYPTADSRPTRFFTRMPP